MAAAVFQALAQPLAHRGQMARALRHLLRQAVAGLGKRSEHLVDLLQRVIDQPVERVCRKRLDGEGRVAGRRGERAMQFARSPPQRLADHQVGREGRLLAFRRLGADRHLHVGILDIAPQRRQKHVPGVALVAHEGEGRRQHRLVAVAVPMLDRAEIGRNVGEARLVGEEACHLDLGLRPGAKAAVDLHDHRVAEDHRDVALLDRHRPRRPGTIEGLRLGIAEKSDAPAIGRLDLRAVAHRRKQRLHHLRIENAVDQPADPWAAPQSGDRVGERGRTEDDVLLAPACRERQEIALRLVVETDVADGEPALPVGQLAEQPQLRRPDAAVLGGEPALELEEFRQALLLELAALAPGKRRADPAVARGQRDEFRQHLGHRLVPGRRLGLVGEQEPVEAVGRQRDQIGQVADRRERRASHQLHRHRALPFRQVELDRLGRARQVGDAQDAVSVDLAHIGEDLAVEGIEDLEGAAAEGGVLLAHRYQAPHPVEQRRRVVDLALRIDRLIAVDRIHDHRQIELLRVRPREAGIEVGRPLHRRAHAVAVAEIIVVAHAELVAVIDDRRARHRHQQRVHQLDLAPVVLHQRRQPAPDAEIDARPAVLGIGAPQIVALAVGHHLQRQLVMVAQEDAPLAALWNVRGLADDVGDRVPVLLRQRHVHARHQRKVEAHMALIALAEIGPRVLRPLVGLGEQHAVAVMGVELGTDLLQHLMRLGQVLVVGAFALDQIGDCVEPEPVDPHVEPVVHHPDHLLQHARIVEVEVGLVRIEAVPEEGAGDRVPGPVRRFRVEEDDPCLGELGVGIAPDVEVARHGAGSRLARLLEPRVLVGGVVDDELGDHPQAPPVRLGDEGAQIPHLPVGRVDRPVVGDIVAVIAQRRGIEGQQPERRDAELLDVVQALHQPGEVADAVIVAVLERLDVKLVDDRVLVPVGLAAIDDAVRPAAPAVAHRGAPGGISRQIA